MKDMMSDEGVAPEHKWIHAVVSKHVGGLHESLGVDRDEPIPEAKLQAAKAGKYGKKAAAQARLARVLESFHRH